MGPKQRIYVEEILHDIRSGMLDSQLVEKYSLSPPRLRRAMEKLIEAKALNFTEVYRRPVMYDDSVTEETQRELPRHYLAFGLNCCDLERPDIMGRVIDISIKGIGVSGLDAHAYEIKTLCLTSRKFLPVDHIVFDAVCHWCGPASPEGPSVAGFEISRIDEEEQKKLYDFIRFITIGVDRQSEAAAVNRH